MIFHLDDDILKGGRNFGTQLYKKAGHYPAKFRLIEVVAKITLVRENVMYLVQSQIR